MAQPRIVVAATVLIRISFVLSAVSLPLSVLGLILAQVALRTEGLDLVALTIAGSYPGKGLLGRDIPVVKVTPP